jgi:hypothetical protein
MARRDTARYLASDMLRNGRQIEIRALRTDDRADLLDAVKRTSALSLYRRFFGAKREFSQINLYWDKSIGNKDVALALQLPFCF